MKRLKASPNQGDNVNRRLYTRLRDWSEHPRLLAGPLRGGMSLSLKSSGRLFARTSLSNARRRAWPAPSLAPSGSRLRN